MTRATQRGASTVEFAIVGLVVLVAILAVIELGRLLFTVSLLNEGARRAARLAAVCEIGSPGITSAATFARLPGLDARNVRVEYLMANGEVAGSPASPAGFATVRYVRARIENYSHVLLIPVVGRSIALSAAVATLPRESLGHSPEGVTRCP